MTDEQWEAILAVHLTAPFRIIRAASTFLRETAKREKRHRARSARKIVNISSTSGTRGNAGQSNYSSGKAGVIGLTKTLAKEWGQFNIQVNASRSGGSRHGSRRRKRKARTIHRGDAEIAIGIPQSAGSNDADDPDGPGRHSKKVRARFCFLRRRCRIMFPARCLKCRRVVGDSSRRAKTAQSTPTMLLLQMLVVPFDLDLRSLLASRRVNPIVRDPRKHNVLLRLAGPVENQLGVLRVVE